jgi:tripartite ATP-independent transporter DctM subunit
MAPIPPNARQRRDAVALLGVASSVSIEILTILMLAGTMALLAIGLPFAFTTGIIACAFALALFGPAGLTLISSRTYSFMNEFVLASVPMFILMASILERSGVAHDLFNAVHIWAGGLPGGVGVATMLMAVLIGATIGVIGGEVTLLGIVALPQLFRLGYDRKLAIGTICAGGALGSMIPPSIILVFFGLAGNVPIGDLLLASVMPGLLLAGLYSVYILIRCNVNPRMGPVATGPERSMPLLQKLKLMKGLVLPTFIVVSVMGSIYAGFASVTESAALGVIGVLIAVWVRGELSLKMLRDSLRETMATCGTVLWLVFGANALIGVYNLMGGIGFMHKLMKGLELPPFMMLVVIMATWVVLGTFLEWIAIMLLTLPIFLPIIKALGYDPVWFGVLFNINMQIAYLSPPFGGACFFLKSVAPPDVTMKEIFDSCWPWMGLQLIGLALVMAFPQIALWLPRVAR